VHSLCASLLRAPVITANNRPLLGLTVLVWSLACGGAVSTPPVPPQPVGPSSAEVQAPAPKIISAAAVASDLPVPKDCDNSFVRVFCEEVDKAEPDMTVFDDIADRVDVNCPCDVDRSALKAGARIPIIKDFMRDKTRNWTETHPPLYLATMRGHRDVMTWLLERGAHPDMPGEFGVPLDAALPGGTQDTVDMLLAAGARAELADLSKTDDFGLIEHMMANGGNGKTIDVNPFLQARRREHLEKLLSYEPDLSKIDPSQLTRVGDEALIRRLLDDGMPVDIETSFGEPWLLVAVDDKDHETMKMLLERGANPNAPDRFDETPLAAAVSHDDEVAVGILIQAGASVTAKSGGFDRTPLEEAIRSGTTPSMVRLLIEHGANPNDQDTWGTSVLQEAIDDGNADVVKVLVEHGATMKVDGKGALQYATSEGASQAMLDALR
jgi:ankyrin repeat protein